MLPDGFPVHHIRLDQRHFIDNAKVSQVVQIFIQRNLDHAIDFIIHSQQILRQIRSILTGDACNQRLFHKFNKVWSDEERY